MNLKLKFSFLLVVGTLLLAVSPTLANVQPAQEFRATPAAAALTTFQTAQAKRTTCPKGTRWSDRDKSCVKTGS